MKEVLILGAGSIIAPFLASRLAAHGMAGIAISRRPPSVPLAPAFPWQALDITTHPLPAEGMDAIVSTLPLWLLPAALARLSPQKQAIHIIAFSSTSRFSKETSADPKERTLAQNLAEAEARLIETCDQQALPWTLLRPTLIYGSGRDQNISAVARFIAKYGFFPVAAPARGLRQPVHAADLAWAAEACLNTPDAYGRAFNLPGGETLTYRHMVERIFTTMGKRPKILPLPTTLLRYSQTVLRPFLPSGYSPALFLRMNQDLAFSVLEAETTLHYQPRHFTPELPEGL